MTPKTPAADLPEPDQATGDVLDTKWAVNIRPSPPLQIYSLMPKLIEAIGPIPKAQWNAGLRFNFRGIDDAQQALSPALTKLGISLQIEIFDHCLSIREDETKKKLLARATLKMRVHFYAPDGSSLFSDAVGEAIDYNGDKATSKSMSSAYKYAVFQALCCTIRGMEDNDQHTPTDAAKPAKPVKPKPPPFDWDRAVSADRRDYLTAGMDKALQSKDMAALLKARDFTKKHVNDLAEADYQQLTAHATGSIKELERSLPTK